MGESYPVKNGIEWSTVKEVLGDKKSDTKVVPLIAE